MGSEMCIRDSFQYLFSPFILTQRLIKPFGYFSIIKWGGCLEYRRLIVLFGLISFCASVFAAPWDFLREPAEQIAFVNPITAWIVFLVSLVLVAVAVMAFKRKKSPRLAWIAAAFAIFFAKRLLIVVDIYFSPGNFMNDALQGFFDLLMILALFVGIFRK